MCASASLFHSLSNSDDTFANTGFLSESKSWCRIYRLMQMSGKLSDYITVQIFRQEHCWQGRFQLGTVTFRLTFMHA